MKTTLFIVILTFLSDFVNAQTVSTSCTAPDSIISKYIDDADRLALKSIQNPISAIIPQQNTNKFLNALLAIYNATTLPASDTITRIYKVHTFTDPVMNQFYIIADSNLNWMKDLNNGKLNTSEPKVNNVITQYGFKIASTFAYNSKPSFMIVLKSDSNYFLPAIMQQISSLNGVQSVSMDYTMGDGNDITATDYNNHIELIYKLGWGDCPSGCISHRYWKFNAYSDCSVEFVGSYGDLLPIMVKSIVLDKTSITTSLNNGNIQLIATILPTNSSNKNIHWSSSEPSVATVNQSGFVTLVSNGSTLITAQSQDGNVKAISTITVENKTEISESKKMHLSVSPNPFIDNIEIKGDVETCNYFVYTNNGQDVLNGILNINGILNLQSLPSGEFILLIKSDRETATFKILKK